jgi:Ca2+-binding RTX toxin-like protein
MTEPAISPWGAAGAAFVGNALINTGQILRNNPDPQIKGVGIMLEGVGNLISGEGQIAEGVFAGNNASAVGGGLLFSAAAAYGIPFETGIAIALAALPEEAGLALLGALAISPLGAAIASGVLAGVIGVGAYTFGSWIGGLLGPTFIRHDPILLDLNYDGVHLSWLAAQGAADIAESHVYFDLNSDGFAERTGWASAADGFLALDLNGNGKIDNGSELFGSSTQDGFTALRSLDTNGDNQITSADTNYADLVIWQDRNQNGVSDAGELSTLADRSIVSIRLDASPSTEARAGNSVLYSSTFTLSNGAVHEAVAVAFSTDQINARYQLPDGFTYDPEVFSLPNLRGYGTAPDLWVAMSLDPVLKQMVQAFVANGGSFSSISDIVGGPFWAESGSFVEGQSTFGNALPERHYIGGSAAAGGGSGGGSSGAMVIPTINYVARPFDEIIFRWALGANSGGEVAAQATASAFINHGLLGSVNVTNDHSMFDFIFQQFSQQMAVRFLAQIESGPSVALSIQLVHNLTTAIPANGSTLSVAEVSAIISDTVATAPAPHPQSAALARFGSLVYDFSHDTITGDVDGFFNSEVSALTFDPANPWAGVGAWYDVYHAEFSVVDPDGSHLLQSLRRWSGNTTLQALLDYRSTTTGDGGANVIVGDQPLPAGYEDNKRDLIYGLGGDDLLQGGTGSDTYVFGDDSGADTVIDTSGSADEIAFQGSLTSALARFSFANGNQHDLLIQFDGRAETITVIGFFDGAGNSTIEHVTFPDGPEISSRAIRDAAIATLGTPGDDTITAFATGSTVVGGAGNDTLIGNVGDDIVVGGVGNDALSESVGNDAYVWNVGDGNDVITGESAFDGINTVSFGSGVSSGDVRFAQTTDGRGLVISVVGLTGSITLPYQLSTYADYGIDFIKFADGTVWDRETYTAKFYEQSSTSGDDTIWMAQVGGEVHAGLGNDSIHARGNDAAIDGGPGSNTIDLTAASNATLLWNRGGGEDVVIAGTAFDGMRNTLRFGAGIAPTDLRFSETADGNGMIVRVAGESGSITLPYQLSTYSDYGIDQFVFSDGTVWNRQTYTAHLYAGISTAGSDVIWMANAGGSIDAGDGNDVVYARGNDSFVAGGSGDDTIYTSSASSTTYVWHLGDGNDTITGGSAGDGINTLRFGPGIAANDLRFAETAEGSGVVITVANQPGSVTLPYQLATYADYGIDQFVFDDGTVWDRATYSQHVYAGASTAGNDVIWMANIGGMLDARAGDDTIHVRGDTVSVTGGAGNDAIYSNSGAHEHYIWNIGDGNDSIFLGYGNGGFLTLSLGVGIAPSGVTLARTANALVVTIGAEGSISINGQSAMQTVAGLGSIAFADGTTWSVGEISARLMAGSAGADYIVGTIGTDVLAGGAGNDVLIGNLGDDVYRFGRGDGVDTIYDQGPAHWWGFESGGNDRVELGADIAPSDVEVIQLSANDLALQIVGTSDRLILTGSLNDATQRIEQVHFADGTIWTFADIFARSLIGTDGNDTIHAGDTASTLAGLAGNDVLVGSSGNDILDGGTGTDTLIGGPGDDVYRFAIGDGTDTIIDQGPQYWWGFGSGGVDAVELGVGVTPDNVEVVQLNGQDLALRIVGTDDELIMTSAIYDSGRRIEGIHFADGTVWTFADLFAKSLIGTDGNDTISAGDTPSSLAGGAGNDTLYGSNGADILEGGSGNDTLVGNGGNDVYRFGIGEGVDTIIDQGLEHWWGFESGGIDTVQLGSGVTPFNIEVAQSVSGDLTLRVVGTTDQLVMSGALSDPSRQIEIIQFADGTVWNYADIVAKSLLGTSGNDTIHGDSTGNIIGGGSGNDVLFGNGGSDTFVFGAGFGHDTIIDFDATSGAPDSLQINRSVFADWGQLLGATEQVGSDLVITFDAADTITLLDVNFADFTQGRVEFVL